MESNQEGKRRNDKYSDEDERRLKKNSKRARTNSRSPPDNHERDLRRKRRHSTSRSPEILAKQDKQTNATNEPDVKKEAPTRRAKETDMLNTRTGGAYIPPARLRMMQAQITDKSSIAYQRLAWEALKKSIHGHINKINVGNIGIIIKELLKENIVRGRGLLCRSVIQAQAASPTFTNVYAALVAAVNSRFPNIGELLLKRLVIQFKRGFKRNDKSICISSASFIAHLVNQRVAHEILALELLTLLVETPTDDSVEVAIAFLKECGQKLTEVSSKGVNAIFEMLRNILHEGQLDKRVQYMIEVMFQVWKDGFKDHPALIEELELVPEEEQFTHLMMLDEATDPQDILNVFKFDEKYEENEQKYKTLSKEILGSDAESGEEGSSGESGSEEEDDDEDEEQKEVTIIDNTETNLVALRRTIYLTINSSLDFEECAHKLMKMQLKPGQEVELCHMFLDCCAEQRTYEKFYGLLAQRFCNINRIYIGPFEEIFKDSYSTAHRLDTNRLRNVSKFFAHLLFTDSISWEVLECVKLNEEDTTSSSRIYIKILFQELAEYMGLKKLNDRLKDPTLQEAFSGLFPRDNPKNTRFSINFFTSIGLGGLTDELREHLKQMPKNIPPPAEIKVDSGSSSDDSSDSSTSSDSSNDSSSSEGEEEQTTKRSSKKHKNKDKEQETLAEQVAKDKNDRWGHDGYYETYGQGARRMNLRDDRQEIEHFDKSRGSKRHDMDSDNRRGARRDAHEENSDNFRRNRNKDDFRREEKRSQYDEDRNRNDDRNDRSRGGQNDERNRRNDDRDDLIGEKSRRDYKNGDGDRRTDDRRRKDDDKHREEDRPRKFDDRSYYNDERSRDRTHNIKDREIENSRRREKDNRDRLNDDRSNRVTEKYRKDDDRVHREEDRRRIDNREQKDDRGRKEGDRSRRDDKISRVDDRSDKVEDREKRNNNRTKTYDSKHYEDDRLRENSNRQQKDIRSAKTDNGEHRTDSTHKRAQKEDRRSDKFRSEDIHESRGKNKTALDKSERDNNRKYKYDRRDSRNENNVSDEELHNSRKDKYEIDKEERHNGEKNAHQKHKKESKTKNAEKEKKKKGKKAKKAKKHKKNKETDSSNDDDSDNKKDKLKANEDTDTDSDSSSSSSSDDNEALGRYWDSFDIKGKSDSINQEKIAIREMKNRDKRQVS